MTSAQIINAVLARMGRQESNTYLQGVALTELQLIQTRLEGGALLPWFILGDEVTSLATTAGQRTVDLPDNFLREHDDFPVYRYDSSQSDPYIRLIKDEFDYLEARFGGEASGIPTEYALLGTQLHLFVTPDDAYPLRGKWFEAQAAFTANNSNAWSIHAADKLIAELGFIMNTVYRHNANVANFYAGEITRADARILADDEARKQALRDARRGDRA